MNITKDQDQELVLKLIKQFYPISSISQQSLIDFVNYLIIYNSSTNLIGKSTVEQIWHRHILDSAQLLPLINNKNDIIADFGSGAGFPGLVLSILGSKEVHLVEKSTKKSQFLHQAKKFSINKVIIHNRKVEELTDLKCKCIVSRALASLDKLLLLSINLLKNSPKSYCLFLKGRNYKAEIIEAQQKFKFDYQLFPSITANDSFIIKVENIIIR